MPVPTTAELGPLAGLAGSWEGDQGIDVSYDHDVGEIVETPYREKVELKPFGPVDNGVQQMFGLDYRMAAYKQGEDEPFHTEVGYWLWDAATGEVMRGFVVPRGITVLAGGIAGADATSWTMKAVNGTVPYSIGENTYLAANASTLSYEVTITVGADGNTWSYDETTMLRMNEFAEPFAHTDHNTLHRVS